MNELIKGISYASVCRFQEQKLLYYSDQLVEFPCDEKEKIQKWINTHGGMYALHYPSEYSVGKLGFELTCVEKRKLVYQDFQSYIEEFPDAEYYLLHFPGLELNAAKEKIEEAFKELALRFEKYNSKVVIENMSYVDACCRAKDYKQLLQKSGLGLCLDIGHAHMVEEGEPFRFWELLGDRIQVIHYYNTTNYIESRYYGQHLPVSFKVQDGICLEEINEWIMQCRHKLYIVDESKEIKSE